MVQVLLFILTLTLTLTFPVLAPITLPVCPKCIALDSHPESALQTHDTVCRTTAIVHGSEAERLDSHGTHRVCLLFQRRLLLWRRECPCLVWRH